MKQSIEAGFDDHPDDDDDRPRAWWIVNVTDDCDGCDDLRVELVLEHPGEPDRVAAHLSPESARKLRAALAGALKTLGVDDP